MDARTCIQMEKICRDIFLAYRLGKCHDKFLPFTTVVAHVIRTLSHLFMWDITKNDDVLIEKSISPRLGSSAINVLRGGIC